MLKGVQICIGFYSKRHRARVIWYSLKNIYWRNMVVLAPNTALQTLLLVQNLGRTKYLMVSTIYLLFFPKDTWIEEFGIVLQILTWERFDS